MTPDDIRALSDADFYQLKRSVEDDAARRTKVAQFPEDLAALVQAVSAAGVPAEDVRANLETALALEGQDTDAP